MLLSNGEAARWAVKGRESMEVGVVVERRRIDNPWQEYTWRPVEVVPGLPPAEEWRLLYEAADFSRYLAGTLTIELFPGETEGYRRNLSQRAPVVFVVLRPSDGLHAERPKPFRVTVCPYEAQEYLEGGDDIVEGVPMPAVVADWVQAYAAKHNQERTFEKRKRRPHDPRRGTGPGPERAGGGGGHG